MAIGGAGGVAAAVVALASGDGVASAFSTRRPLAS